MDTARIRASLTTIESQLELAREARTQIENDATGRRTEGGIFEDPEAALGGIVTNLYELLLVVLEAAAMPETRTRLIGKWAVFEKNDQIRHTSYCAEFDSAENEALNLISTIVEGVRSASGDEQSPRDGFELAQLETLLRRTAVLVHEKNASPKSELDVQRVMRDYLSALFTEYRRKVVIPGIIKDFKPDGGVRNLRVAIEFKFVDSKTEAAKAIGGIFEDLAGYAGSRDWNRFYTVIYQTEPFESEDRVRSELTRAGALTWKAILVTGPGSRKAKKKSNRPAAKVP